MTNELVKVQELNIVRCFMSDTTDYLTDVLNEAAKKARALAPDTSTAKGRKEIAHVAQECRRSKTLLDEAGKNLIAAEKERLKKVDVERKRVRDFFDGLTEEVRMPLTLWEKAESDRIEAERKAEGARVAAVKAEAERIEAENKAAEQARLEAEKAKLEAERSALAAERVKLEAEKAAIAKVEAEKRAEAERAELEKREAAEKAEREKRIAEEAKQQAERDAKLAAAKAAAEAEARRLAELKAAAEKAEAEKQAIIKAQLEKERLAAEEKAAKEKAEAKAKAEAEAKAADAAHRQAVISGITQKLVALGVPGVVASEVVDAMISGAIPHVKVVF